MAVGGRGPRFFIFIFIIIILFPHPAGLNVPHAGRLSLSFSPVDESETDGFIEWAEMSPFGVFAKKNGSFELWEHFSGNYINKNNKSFVHLEDFKVFYLVWKSVPFSPVKI